MSEALRALDEVQAFIETVVVDQFNQSITVIDWSNINIIRKALKEQNHS